MAGLRTISVLSLLAWLLLAADVRAQAEQTPEHLLDEPLTEPGDEEAEEERDAREFPASSEVDFNEENFRRSMELRDRTLQRSPDLTTGSYSRGTGVQVLDELPESSQKHLREQLREIIVENGPWTPEEGGESYPYVPSAEAEENGGLRKREEAAWGELVARYHEREAAIHANRLRSRSATARGQEGSGAADEPGTNAGGPSAAGDSQKPGEAGREADKAERQAALESMLDAGEASAAGSAASAAQPGEQGVSQNALELLTERHQLPPAGPEVEAGENEPEETEVEFDTEGVIAIEDLENIQIDPEAKEKD